MTDLIEIRRVRTFNDRGIEKIEESHYVFLDGKLRQAKGRITPIK